MNGTRPINVVGRRRSARMCRLKEEHQRCGVWCVRRNAATYLGSSFCPGFFVKNDINLQCTLTTLRTSESATELTPSPLEGVLGSSSTDPPLLLTAVENGDSYGSVIQKSTTSAYCLNVNSFAFKLWWCKPNDGVDHGLSSRQSWDMLTVRVRAARQGRFRLTSRRNCHSKLVII